MVSLGPFDSAVSNGAKQSTYRDPTGVDFSVLIPVYQAEEVIETALESVSIQTLKPYEVVIVNDGSTDQTSEKITEWAKLQPFPVRLIMRGENKGLSYSLKEGLGICTGKWVARIDADDYWDECHLESLSAAITQNQSSRNPKRLVLVGARAKMRNIERSTDYLLSQGPLRHEEVVLRLCWDNPFVHSAVAFDREAALTAGGYSGHRWEDYDLWIRLARLGRCHIDSAATVNYIESQASLSRISRRSAIRSRLQLQVLAIRTLSLPAALKNSPFLLAAVLRSLCGIALPGFRVYRVAVGCAKHRS